MARQDALRCRGAPARPCSVGELNKLEEAWRSNPSATLADLVASDGALLESEPTPVQMRYEDAYQYQNIMGPLVKLEADYDKGMKEAQAQDRTDVRWDQGLNKKRVAHFVFNQHDNNVKLVVGDELLLRTPATPPTRRGRVWARSSACRVRTTPRSSSRSIRSRRRRRRARRPT